MASCLPSGLQERPSGWCSLELTFFGADGDGDPCGEVDGLALPLVLGEPIGSELLKDWIVAPWSRLATATRFPSGEIAIGPSSGLSVKGKGFTTPASALSQYQEPMPKARTA